MHVATAGHLLAEVLFHLPVTPMGTLHLLLEKWRNDCIDACMRCDQLVHTVWWFRDWILTGYAAQACFRQWFFKCCDFCFPDAHAPGRSAGRCADLLSYVSYVHFCCQESVTCYKTLCATYFQPVLGGPCNFTGFVYSLVRAWCMRAHAHCSFKLTGASAAHSPLMWVSYCCRVRAALLPHRIGIYLLHLVRTWFVNSTSNTHAHTHLKHPGLIHDFTFKARQDGYATQWPRYIDVEPYCQCYLSPALTPTRDRMLLTGELDVG